MKLIKSIHEMQQYMKRLKLDGKEVGFVPTMGYLHEGHQQLMREARKQNDVVVVSIFVNPLQFGPNEDFDRYPRDEEHDLHISENEKVDVLFFPHVEEMYPVSQSITMTVRNRVNVLCGASREGHFDGVVTVLAKLFNIVQPDNVYFGMKDAQQVAVVDALINDYNFNLNLVPVPTVRENDGLAKSSRNVYLSTEERADAPYIYKALQHGKYLIESGEKNVEQIIDAVSLFINQNTRGKIDYVDVLTYPNLEKISMIKGQVIIAVAVQFQHARLIDNVVITQQEASITEGM